MSLICEKILVSNRELMKSVLPRFSMYPDVTHHSPRMANIPGAISSRLQKNRCPSHPRHHVFWQSTQRSTESKTQKNLVPILLPQVTTTARLFTPRL
jgi:hypothetical protein